MGMSPLSDYEISVQMNIKEKKKPDLHLDRSIHHPLPKNIFLFFPLHFPFFSLSEKTKKKKKSKKKKKNSSHGELEEEETTKKNNDVWTGFVCDVSKGNMTCCNM